jgi:hypothetical protein
MGYCSRVRILTTSKEKSVKIELEVQEVNGVLMALAQRPFAEVNDLIAKIRSQAQGQLEAVPDLPEPDEAAEG